MQAWRAVAGGPGGAIDPMTLIGGGTRLLGIYVGNRQMHEDLARFVEAGKHFGKVAIQMSA